MSSASTHWSIKNIIVRTILILIFLNSLCFYSLHRVFLTTNCPAMKDIVELGSTGAGAGAGAGLGNF